MCLLSLQNIIHLPQLVLIQSPLHKILLPLSSRLQNLFNLIIFVFFYPALTLVMTYQREMEVKTSYLKAILSAEAPIHS